MEAAAHDHLLCEEIARAFRGTSLDDAVCNRWRFINSFDHQRIKDTLIVLGLMTEEGVLTRSGRRVRLFLDPVLKVPGNIVRHTLELAAPYRDREARWLTSKNNTYNRAIDETALWLESSYNVPGREKDTLAAWRNLHNLLDELP